MLLLIITKLSARPFKESPNIEFMTTCHEFDNAKAKRGRPRVGPGSVQLLLMTFSILVEMKSFDVMTKQLNRTLARSKY